MCVAEARCAGHPLATANDVPLEEVFVLLRDPAMPLQLENKRTHSPSHQSCFPDAMPNPSTRSSCEHSWPQLATLVEHDQVIATTAISLEATPRQEPTLALSASTAS